MRDLLDQKGIFWLLILLHVILGFLLKYAPSVVGIYFVCFIAFAILNVFVTGDRGDRAASFVLYVIGFEILYRMSDFIVFYEMGKYGAIAILLVGSIIGKRVYFAPVLLLLLVILIPSIFLTYDSDPERIREMVLFNLSGP